MTPNIFVKCKIFNNECKRTNNIQNKFAEFIKLKEKKVGNDLEEITISHKDIFQELESYCKGCDDFSPIE